MNVFHRSNLALAIFDIVDLKGTRAAQVWAFERPDLIEMKFDYRYERDVFAFNQPPSSADQYGELTIKGRQPHGIHVVNADDLADAVRNHWGRFTSERAIDTRREIERG